MLNLNRVESGFLSNHGIHELSAVTEKPKNFVIQQSSSYKSCLLRSYFIFEDNKESLSSMEIATDRHTLAAEEGKVWPYFNDLNRKNSVKLLP